MRYLKILIAGLGVAVGFSVLVSCNKTDEKLATEITDLNNRALVQVFVATVNATRNYVYVDAKQVTGATLGSGSVYPPSATGIGLSVEPGLRTFVVRDTLPTTTQIPLSFAENFNGGRHYTIFLYDTIRTPKQKTVQDNILIPADTSSRIRFANFIYNTTAVPNVDVFSFVTNSNIFTNVAVTDVTEFISYPSRRPLDTLYIRETGTMNLLLKTSIGTLTPKRNYTFVYRGSHKGTRTSTFYATY